MDYKEEQLLREILGKDFGLLKKQAENVLDNGMWSTMIDGALKALEIVALASLDWKLTGIVKLLQSWLADKREEKRQKKMEQQPEVDSDPWQNMTYY